MAKVSKTKYSIGSRRKVSVLSENILACACAYTQIKEQQIKIGETHRENKPHPGKYEAKELIRKRQEKGQLNDNIRNK